ncbi:TPA: oligosaccharide flippase family protein [Photobacterium damselae]
MKLQLFKNTIYSLSTTVVNLIFPLIIVPLIIKMYGVSGYGSFVSVTSGAVIITIILDFGYTQGLPKHILNNVIAAKNSVWLVIGSKLIFFLILTPIVIIYFDKSVSILLLSFVGIISVEPIMLALDKYKEMLKYQVLSKVIYLSFVFLIYFFDLNIHYLIVAYAVSLFSFNILCVLNILFDRDLSGFCKVKISTYKNVISDCFKFYISNSFVNVYQQTSVFFVSIFCGEQITGYYALSNQLYKVAQGVIGSISKVYYTRMLNNKKISEMLKIINIVLSFYIIGWVVIFFFGESILGLLSSNQDNTLFYISIIFYLSLFFVILSSFLGYPYLTPIGKENYSHLALILSTIIYFSLYLLFYLTGNLDVYIFAIMILSADFIGAVIRVYYAIRFKRLYYSI